MERGVGPEGQAVTDALSSDLERFLGMLRARGVRESTLRVYRRDLAQYLISLRKRRVSALWMLDSALIRRWLSDLRAAGFSSGSVARKAKEARAFTTFALVDGPDPFAGVRLPRARPSRQAVLSPAEVERLLAVPDDSAVGQRDRAVLAVLYATGLRVAELALLDLRQIDLDQGTIARWDASGRAVPAFLGRFATEALRAYCEVGRRLLGRRGERALFLSQKGGRLSARAIEHLVARHAKSAEVKASPRDLRAACAAHLRAGGASAGTVQRLLGTTGGSRTAAPSV